MDYRELGDVKWEQIVFYPGFIGTLPPGYLGLGKNLVQGYLFHSVKTANH